MVISISTINNNMKTRKEFIQSDPQVIECPPIFKKGGNIKIKVKCATCNKISEISLQAYWNRRKNGSWSCFECLKPSLIEKSKNNPLYLDLKYKEQFRNLHKNPEYYQRVHNKEVCKKISKSESLYWQS